MSKIVTGADIRGQGLRVFVVFMVQIFRGYKCLKNELRILCKIRAGISYGQKKIDTL